MTEPRKLRVFLCHASQDKPVVRELYQRLATEGWIDPWLDTKKLLPGEDWRMVIEEAVESADIVIICLSNNSVVNKGFLQREMRYAQEISLEKPEGTLALIPLRLEACDMPRGMRFLQWVDYYDEQKEQNYVSLLVSFRIRYEEVLRRDEQKRFLREREAEELVARRQQEEKARRYAEKRTREATQNMVEVAKLSVFLCHASKDKPVVRELHRKLSLENWIDPWLDEEKLFPGQQWDLEIEKAVKKAHAVIVCLSTNSVDKEGYIQRELRYVLRIAEEKIESSIFVIPLRLNECLVPTRLKEWQYVDYFPKSRKDWAYKRVIGALRLRQNAIK